MKDRIDLETIVRLLDEGEIWFYPIYSPEEKFSELPLLYKNTEGRIEVYRYNDIDQVYEKDLEYRTGL